MTWSFRAFTIFGIEVRIHWILVLFWLSTTAQMVSKDAPGLTFGFALSFVALLWLSILLHEFGHCFAARARGMEANQVLLWPLGGLAFCGENGNPKDEIFVAAMGPAVSLALAGLFGAAAFVVGAPPGSVVESTVDWVFSNPFTTWTPPGADFFVPCLMRAVFLANVLMFMFNVFVPAFPLDGGRIARGVLTLKVGFERATLISTAFAMGAAVVLGLIGVAAKRLDVVGLGIYIFLVARQERIMLREGGLDGASQTFLGHDFSMGYTSLARGDEAERERRRRGPGLAARIGKLVGRARPTPEEKPPPPPVPEPQKEPVSMRQQVDHLLEKVGKTGLASLTEDERRFLESASRRFQSMRKPD